MGNHSKAIGPFEHQHLQVTAFVRASRFFIFGHAQKSPTHMSASNESFGPGASLGPIEVVCLKAPPSKADLLLLNSCAALERKIFPKHERYTSVVERAHLFNLCAVLHVKFGSAHIIVLESDGAPLLRDNFSLPSSPLPPSLPVWQMTS